MEFNSIPNDYRVKSAIRIFTHYSMIVVEGSYDDIAATYPDAINIYEDIKLKAVYEPNDEYFEYQWNMQNNHYHLSRILDRGILGSTDIIIGILDTGIAFEDYLLPFDEALLVYSSTGSYKKYDDFDGINFQQGYDFINDDNHPNDMNGHGTSCCGIIAGAINNNYELAGIVYNASIMPVRVLDHEGTGNMSNIMAGIDYAVANGCDVLNLSLAGPVGDSIGWHPLHLSIINAVNNNVAVVCATGNEGVNELSYPAAFPEAIAVGAVDYFKDRAPYSQYGDYIDFVAPGGYVYQDINNNGDYDGGILVPSFDFAGTDIDVSSFNIYYGEGTSYAAPHITALAALLYSIGFNDPYEIEMLMQASCIDLGTTGYDLSFGWGYPDPEILFDIPISVKFIHYEHPSNTVDIVAIPLRADVVCDSAKLMWMDNEELINIETNNNKFFGKLYGLNSGVYDLHLYVNDNDSIDTIFKSIIVKSPFDTNSYIYNGDFKVTFTDDNGLISIDNGFITNISGTSAIIKMSVESNPSLISVMHKGRLIDIARDKNNIEFVSDEQGIYKILYSELPVEDISPKNQMNVLILKEMKVNFDQEGKLFDCSGRMLQNINGNIDMSVFPVGIYYIKSETDIWKLIKVF